MDQHTGHVAGLCIVWVLGDWIACLPREIAFGLCISTDTAGVAYIAASHPPPPPNLTTFRSSRCHFLLPVGSPHLPTSPLQIASGVVTSLVAAAGKGSSETSALFGQTMLGLATTLDNVDAIEQEGGLSLILSSFHVRRAQRTVYSALLRMLCLHGTGAAPSLSVVVVPSPHSSLFSAHCPRVVIPVSWGSALTGQCCV